MRAATAFVPLAHPEPLHGQDGGPQHSSGERYARVLIDASKEQAQKAGRRDFRSMTLDERDMRGYRRLELS